MSKELYFNDELRKCLNAVGLSDCGENDQWNYWYQRLHKAHDVAVDRVTETQRAENAKLRDLAERFYWYVRSTHQDKSYIKFQDGLVSTFENLFDELGIEIG